MRLEYTHGIVPSNFRCRCGAYDLLTGLLPAKEPFYANSDRVGALQLAFPGQFLLPADAPVNNVPETYLASPISLTSAESAGRSVSCPARPKWAPYVLSLNSAFAPRLQVEHSTRRFDNSSLPPSLLALIFPTWNLALCPVRSSISPGITPHIRQNRSSRPRTVHRNLAGMPRPKAISHFSRERPVERRVFRHRLIGFVRQCLRIHILLTILPSHFPVGIRKMRAMSPEQV